MTREENEKYGRRKQGFKYKNTKIFGKIIFLTISPNSESKQRGNS
jgi:hypothetical protein